MEPVKKELLQQEFNFYGHVILATCYRNQWYFFPRHMCESLGLAWQSQQQKLRSQSTKFSCHDIVTTGKDGKHYKMLGVPATHINTWILSINVASVKEGSRKKLQRYQDKLSGWLYEVGFLGAAINEDLPVESHDHIVSAARHRVILKQEAMADYESKIDIITNLPEGPGMPDYKAQHVRLLTDVKLGLVNPLSIMKARGVISLTESLFNNAYLVEGWCPEKIACFFSLDFVSAAEVLCFIREHSYPEPPPMTPLTLAEAGEMTKLYYGFGYTYTDLVLRFNKPSQVIKATIKKIMDRLRSIFKKYKREMPAIPEHRAPNTLSERLKCYYGTPEWLSKRDAYFQIFNGCIDCGTMQVASARFNPHHLHYNTLGKEVPGDLVPLCRTCHEIREGKR